MLPAQALIYFAPLLSLLFSVQNVAGQTLVNGQVFTNGLAIIDSPAPPSTLHAGATQSIAIDISGNGRLATNASIPGSGLSTRFDSLEVYVFSYQTNLNLTISQGPGLLTQESGSTVKHINWVIDTCMPSGNYNLTFYEISHIQDQQYFIITPFPVEIQNTNVSGGCNTTNALASFPELSSAPSHSPWLDSSQTSILPFPSATGVSSGATLNVAGLFMTVMTLILPMVALRSDWL